MFRGAPRGRLWVAGLTLSLVTVALGASCGADARTTASTTKADQALDNAMQRLVRSRGGPPGIIAVVQRGGQLKVHVAGVANVATGAKPVIGDHMRIASVSKAFSGATAVALVKQGRLSLDDTIGKWLPSLPATWHGVTLAEALHHTSGLPDYSASKGFTRALVASPFKAPPPTQLLSFVKDEPLQFTPGSRYRYDNSDNIVVGLIVQAAARRPYEQVLRDKVLGPLGLQNTSLPSGMAVPSPIMHGYFVQPPNPPKDATYIYSPGWPWASGGVVSTQADVNRFIRGYVRGATTNRATNARQFQFVPGSSDPPGPGANDAGLGIFRYTTRCGTVYGHTGSFGSTGGYTQFAAASRDGSRSATVSETSASTPQSDPLHWPALRNVFLLAVCAALAGR